MADSHLNQMSGASQVIEFSRKYTAVQWRLAVRQRLALVRSSANLVVLSMLPQYGGSYRLKTSGMTSMRSRELVRITVWLFLYRLETKEQDSMTCAWSVKGFSCDVWDSRRGLWATSCLVSASAEGYFLSRRECIVGVTRVRACVYVSACLVYRST